MSNEKVFDDISKRLDKFMKGFAEEIETRVVRRTPNPPSIRQDGTGPSTGYLKSRWKGKIKPSMYILSNDAEYASYVEFGTTKMRGAFMLTTTSAEGQQIADRVVRRLKV